MSKHFFVCCIIAFILGALFPQPVVFVRGKLGV